MTKIFKVDKIEPEFQSISYAAEVLKKGGTVAFPTETVYGLGANALDEDAVNRIFAAKGRPSDNPLIVHIWNINQINELVSEIPDIFFKLAEKFWPGPLTLVMKKSSWIPELVTAGLDTVGIRMPNHPAALLLLKYADIPVAAPSANISGSPSPTRVEHVINDLNNKVDVIIDGGDCAVGLESTVLDITGNEPVILRPGGVTPEQIEKTLGRVVVDKYVYSKLETQSTKPRSPGVKYKHYSPRAKVIVVDGPLDKLIAEINKQAQNHIKQNKRVGIMATEQTKDYYVYGEILSAGDREKPETIAANFFRLLRFFDEKGMDVILTEGIDRSGIGIAIMNRMIRAAGYNVINV